MPDLKGQRVVVTRAAHQAEELAIPLRELGAEVILLPVIAIAPPADLAQLKDAAARANEFDWIVFSSSNAVDAFVSALPANARMTSRIAAMGQGTAARLRAAGFAVSIVPDDSISEGLAAVLSEHEIRGKKVLLPSAAVRRDVLAVQLSRQGADVHVVEAYRNVVPSEIMQRAPEVFREPLPHWATFASPSAVNNLVGLVPPAVLGRCRLASIGPVTSDALRKRGLTPTVEADPHSVRALVDAMASSNQNV